VHPAKRREAAWPAHPRRCQARARRGSEPGAAGACQDEREGEPGLIDHACAPCSPSP
jgi:hypothetical protein